MTQEGIAARVGRARSTVANTLRLLDLDERIHAYLVEGRLSEGHARAIGGLPPDQQVHVAEIAIERDLSTRETEELVRRLREPRPDGAGRRGRAASTPTSSGSKRTCDARSARRSRSRDHAREAGSSSSTTATRSSVSSTTG